MITEGRGANPALAFEMPRATRSAPRNRAARREIRGAC
jgi:hypothetical protein